MRLADPRTSGLDGRFPWPVLVFWLAIAVGSGCVHEAEVPAAGSARAPASPEPVARNPRTAPPAPPPAGPTEPPARIRRFLQRTAAIAQAPRITLFVYAPEGVAQRGGTRVLGRIVHRQVEVPADRARALWDRLDARESYTRGRYLCSGRGVGVRLQRGDLMLDFEFNCGYLLFSRAGLNGPLAVFSQDMVSRWRSLFAQLELAP